jgi:hypothetical protein
MFLGNRPTPRQFFEITLWILSHLASQFKTTHMKLRLTLVIMCLLGLGLFARAQDKKKASGKPVIENSPDAIPVTVIGHRKTHHRKPPPPPPMLVRDKPLPPSKVEIAKFEVPKKINHAEKPPPPPPPIGKDGKPLPPPKVEVTRFAPPKIVKDKVTPPPPPPAKRRTKGEKPVTPEAPPPPPEKAE